MNRILLKSTVKNVVDYHDVDISRFYTDVEVDECEIENKLLAVQKKHAKVIDGDVVENGDQIILTCACESNSRFNKKSIGVRVGKKLFSKELEAALIGAKKNETRTVMVKDAEVICTVKDIKRSILPDIKTELWKLTGDDSYADLWNSFRDEYILEQCSGMADEAYAYLAKAVVDKTEFEFTKEEIELSYAVAKLNLNAEENSELGSELVENYAKTYLETSVLGQQLASKNGDALTDEDYEDYIRSIATEQDLDEATVKNQISKDFFAIECNAHYYMDKLDVFTCDKAYEHYRSLV